MTSNLTGEIANNGRPFGKRIRLSPEHEKFCATYAKFGGAYGAGARAYRAAYPAARNYADQQVAELASALLRKSKIRNRIEQLRERMAKIAEEKFDISAEKIIGLLVELCSASVESIVHAHPNGVVEIDLSKADAATMRGFQTLKVRGYALKSHGDRGTVKFSKRDVLQIEITLPDRVAALTLLGRHLGLFSKNVRSQMPPDLAERLQAAIERRRAAVKKLD